MRSLEALLLAALLFSLLVSATPRLGDGPWPRRCAFISLLLAVVQAWVEGPRWQVVPAYALTGVLLSMALLRHAAVRGRIP